jgi:hypothetical protein
MSNHFSADYLKFPSDDTRLDLTDAYAFRSTEDPGKTVLIIDSNPTVRPPIELPPAVITSRDFHPGALSIALEVPDDMLGADPQIGIWASISLRRDGTLTQMDRGGNPTIDAFINPDGEKDLYNSR